MKSCVELFKLYAPMEVKKNILLGCRVGCLIIPVRSTISWLAESKGFQYKIEVLWDSDNGTLDFIDPFPMKLLKSMSHPLRYTKTACLERNKLLLEILSSNVILSSSTKKGYYL